MRNAQAFNQMASDKRWVNLMGAMKEVGRDLNSLAPRPDRASHNGALFVRDEQKAANRNDGATLANMLIGAFVGAHIGAATGIEGLQYVDSGNTVDAYDAYQHDRQNNRTSGEGNRGIELGQSAVICGGFNMTARNTEKTGDTLAWDAYLRDLPNRRIVEQNLGSLNRQADRLEKEYMSLQRKMAPGF